MIYIEKAKPDGYLKGEACFVHLDAKWPASESWKSGKISIHMCQQRKTEKKCLSKTNISTNESSNF